MFLPCHFVYAKWASFVVSSNLYCNTPFVPFVALSTTCNLHHSWKTCPTRESTSFHLFHLAPRALRMCMLQSAKAGSRTSHAARCKFEGCKCKAARFPFPVLEIGVFLGEGGISGRDSGIRRSRLASTSG